MLCKMFNYLEAEYEIDTHLQPTGVSGMNNMFCPFCYATKLYTL